MNDSPFKNVPPNERDLEHAEHGRKFPAEPVEVDVEDKLQFYVRENDEDTTYMQLSKFWSYNRAYILDVDAKSSAAKLFSSLKAT